MDEKKDDGRAALTIDDLYGQIRKSSILWNEKQTLRYITSRSTDENLRVIRTLSLDIKNICKSFCTPIEGNSSNEAELQINAFKYLICNTTFASMSSLAENATIYYISDKQPPLSPYLFIEILWNIGFENILGESILYFPLVLCIDILEILPRCMGSLNFLRASDFLTSCIFNTYKKFILTRDIGDVSKNVIENCKQLSGLLQELILYFTSERLFFLLYYLPLKSHFRFLEPENDAEANRYKIYGIFMKKMFKMVKRCLLAKFESIEHEGEIMDRYNLISVDGIYSEKLDNIVFQEILEEIDRELITILFNKGIEITSDMLMDWVEYNDEEQTSLTLQRAIGLESDSFINDLKDYDYSNIAKFAELIKFCNLLSFKPEPTNNRKAENLLDGACEGNVDDMISLFANCKEFDISLLSKEICENLIEQFAKKLSCKQEQWDLEGKLLTSFARFVKLMSCLNISLFYELTLYCIFHFCENERMEIIFDLASLERHIIANPYINTTSKMAVIMYFLCLNAKSTLKVILKMIIKHSDYSFMDVNYSNLSKLHYMLRIRLPSNYDTIMESLYEEFHNKEKESKVFYQKWSATRKEKKEPNREKPNTVALVIKVLQEICLEKPAWAINKFAHLLMSLKEDCFFMVETVKEILTPLLLLSANSEVYLKATLVELDKLIGKYDFNQTPDLATILEVIAVHLLNSNDIRKDTVDILIAVIFKLQRCFTDFDKSSEHVYSNYYMIMLGLSNGNADALNLLDIIGIFASLYRSKISIAKENDVALDKEHLLRYLLLKCTKQRYRKYTNEIIASCGQFLQWPSTTDIFNNIIRLTFETCLLCLEFPHIGCLSNISFLINCLIAFLARRLRKREVDTRAIYKSLNSHIRIFEASVKCTAIANDYAELLDDWRSPVKECSDYLISLKLFSRNCERKDKEMNSFGGQHSPIAIKFLLGYNIVNWIIHDNESMEIENFIKQLDVYLSK
ncbi:PREDICTED: uncharacterized protein LOC105368395 [Ceratosolen solmsi marchali]|uniref:Uncharacterized protein LOC105368395 n=1 Tax=Ceratosolen solmsi marchali TaxID=326594 RepID=A0AAJ7E2R9_9HYME|nr:PREDICTED: uncharacterized protein LOC105368395 [Ceratosolen solmsi marchali]